MSGFFRGSKRIEKEEGYWRKLLRLQDGQIGKVGTINGDLYIVFGKFFRSFQFDLYFLILLLLDRDRLFQVIVMQAQALDGDIILSGGDLRDRDAVVIASGINLVNDACTGVVETIENDQHGILMVLCVEVAEFEANGACIDHFSGFGGVAGCGSRQGTLTGSANCYREEQTGEVSC
jgi:hypothetical protein